MNAVLQAQDYQENKGNLSKAIEDVQKLIDQLQDTRDVVAQNPDMSAFHVAKLKDPVKRSFDKIEDDLKDVNKGLNQYQKALREKFKNAALPSATNDALSSQPDLINRAIAMHLLREGKFDVARTFVREVIEHSSGSNGAEDLQTGTGRSWIKDLADSDEAMHDGAVMTANGEVEGSGLQKRFAEMYHILDALRNQHNLEPAIEWAKRYSYELESRGSNLEFELSRLKFVELYRAKDSISEMLSEDPFVGPLRALTYARTTFSSFSTRYARETSNLLGSLAFSPDLETSPYKQVFYNQYSFEEASASFTREFCGMLGLSSQSPLYTAVTAGGIALPVLEKVERVMAQARGQWTSVNELPVETPLPPGFLFHSIFVCPVSKEQATDANPPMMLPCGHVIAKESLDMNSKGKS